MKKVVLIACSNKKLDCKSKAKELYISPLFKKSIKYAKKIEADKIYILSAKHGLLNLNDEIEPYDITLKNMKTKEKKEWADNLLSELKKNENLNDTKFIFLAGNDYRKYLIGKMPNYDIPMKGLKIGEQLQFLKKEIENG